MARRYVQRDRAVQAAETRRRIVEAALRLHTTVGPLATTISEIAARAGVERPTVYRHFPSERRLLAACTSHFASLHPSPLISLDGSVPAPERVEAALLALYAHYDRVGDLLVPIARDQEADPARLGSGMADQLDRLTGALLRGWKLERAARRQVRALVRVALSLWTWRSLVREQGLSGAAAARLMARAVMSAAGGGSRPPER